MQSRMKESYIDGASSIIFCFPYNELTNFPMKKIDDKSWSSSLKLWHIPYEKSYINTLNKRFKGKFDIPKNKERKLPVVLSKEDIKKIRREAFND